MNKNKKRHYELMERVNQKTQEHKQTHDEPIEYIKNKQEQDNAMMNQLNN